MFPFDQSFTPYGLNILDNCMTCPVRGSICFAIFPPPRRRN